MTLDSIRDRLSEILDECLAGHVTFAALLVRSLMDDLEDLGVLT